MMFATLHAPVEDVEVRRLPGWISVDFNAGATGRMSFYVNPLDPEAAVLFAKQLRHAADELEPERITAEHDLDPAGANEPEADCG